MIPDIGIANGIMSAVLNFAKAMPDDIKFDIIYFQETEKTRAKEIETLGGKVYKLKKPSPNDLIGNFEIKRFFAQHKNEWKVLHIHAPHFAVFIAPEAKKSGIKKICCHCHSTEFSLNGNSKRNKILSLYSKYFIKDKFACSKIAGDFWYGNKPFTIINNAIDCSKFRYNEQIRIDKRKELNLDDSLVICHIGKTSIPQKNHKFLVYVFAEIQNLNSKAKLFLIGAEKTEEYSLLCKELNISDSVFFMQTRSDVSELLNCADVFVFPSTKEGLPVSIIEAQAAGLPVLMSDSVSSEAIVTNLVRTKSLNASYIEWAKDCISLSEFERKDTFDSMIDAGWDIHNSFDSLIRYYRG